MVWAYKAGGWNEIGVFIVNDAVCMKYFYITKRISMENEVGKEI